jgi:hypothetical protein
MDDEHVERDVNGLSISEEDARPIAGIVNGVVLGVAFLVAVLVVVVIALMLG